MTTPGNNSAVLEAIDTIRGEIDHLNEQIKCKKNQIISVALSLSECTERKERLISARALYWNYDGVVPAWAITAGLLFDNLKPARNYDPIRRAAEAAGGLGLMRRLIGPAGSVPCKSRGCNGRYFIKSRAALAKYHAKDADRYIDYGGDSYLCDDCLKAYREAMSKVFSEEDRQAREEERRARHQKALDELRGLEEKSNLSQGELIRLYELMSIAHWEEAR